jgi:uncharacterized iron-regulated membrane protein
MSATPETTAPETAAPETTAPEARTHSTAPTGWAALRPLVLRLHFYAGVLVAPFLAIACLTGLIYVFSPQLSDAVYADELLVGPHAGPARPLDEQVAAALAAHPACFAVFVDHVPAAAQAARTARVSCGVACSGHGP